jgi:hypothetical protein
VHRLRRTGAPGREARARWVQGQGSALSALPGCKDWALLTAGCVDTEDLHDPGRFDCVSASQPCPLRDWVSVGVDSEAGGTQVRVRFRENRQVVVPWDQVLPPTIQTGDPCAPSQWVSGAALHPSNPRDWTLQSPVGPSGTAGRLLLGDTFMVACPWLPDGTGASGVPVAASRRPPPSLRGVVVSGAVLLVPECHVGAAVVALLPRVAHATHVCRGVTRCTKITAMREVALGVGPGHYPPQLPTQYRRTWYYSAGQGPGGAAVAGAWRHSSWTWLGPRQLQSCLVQAPSHGHPAWGRGTHWGRCATPTVPCS